MNNQKIPTIFFGAGNFAVKILENLLTIDYLDLKAIITQPDKEAGRKKELTPPAVKHFILEQKSGSIKSKLLQPVKLKLETKNILNEFKPELIIVADYGQMIPNSIIDYPKYKCLNIHGSILPKYRGAVPAAMAILNGDKTTGVSIPVMTYKLDDGAVLDHKEIEILDTDTTYSLRMRLAEIGNGLLNEILPFWLSGELIAKPQNESEATITWEKDLEKEKAYIFSFTPVIQAERMIRAFSPWPIAWTEIIESNSDKSKRLKIYKAKIENTISSNFEKGTIFKDNKKLFLKLDDGVLELLEVQIEGKKVLKGKDYLFLNGAKLKK